MKYKLKDLQGSGLKEDKVFDSIADVIENLANYHDMDYEGMRDNGTKYDNIYQFLSTLKGERARLDFLLEYGDWELVTLEN